MNITVDRFNQSIPSYVSIKSVIINPTDNMVNGITGNLYTNDLLKYGDLGP